ncbi:MAG: hypothetical protein AB8G05_22035 [Oligoflexales bacterium]
MKKIFESSEHYLERRRLVGSLGSCLQLGIIFLSACKLQKRDDFKKEIIEPVGEPNGQGPSDENPDDEKGSSLDAPLGTQDPESNQSCNADTNVIEWSKLENAYENLEPSYKFYGDSSSSMLVLSLPKYQHGNLIDVYLVRYSGKLIAQKGITEIADINENTTLKPIVFDNIQMKDDKRLVIIYKVADNQFGIKFTKHEMRYDVTFSDNFRGKPAYGMTPSSVPGYFAANQATPSFGPDPNVVQGFYDLGNYTVGSEDAFFAGSPALKGYIITDLMGNTLSENGEKFNNLIQFPEFICYKLVDNKFYLRTFIRTA